MTINQKLNNHITKNLPFYSLTLPSLIYAISIFIPLEYEITLSIGLGSCELFNFAIPLPLKNLLIFVAGTINIIILVIVAYTIWKIRDDATKRHELYNIWEIKAKYSICILLFLFINTLCYKNKGIDGFFKFDTNALGIYLITMIFLFFLVKIGANESKKDDISST